MHTLLIIRESILGSHSHHPIQSVTKKLWKRKVSLTLGSPFTSGEISLDRKGASEAWRRAQQLRETDTEDPQPEPGACCCRQRLVLKPELWRTDPGRELGLAAVVWAGVGRVCSRAQVYHKKPHCWCARMEGQDPIIEASFSACSQPGQLHLLKSEPIPMGNRTAALGLKSEPSQHLRDIQAACISTAEAGPRLH
ncbi:hypothetical protein Cadr_000011616 [Camelus dromedarius]|uniref:Uncharacterized protein n=1 Tax=Camelus dromedarius TaxID=9838 RepID=A0A5N4DR72_CAMDR|nr:hypothetical protein Cadr_000011616 [Camelus dromedarius]